MDGIVTATSTPTAALVAVGVGYPWLSMLQLLSDALAIIALTLLFAAMLGFVRHNKDGIRLLSGDRTVQFYYWICGLCGLFLLTIVSDDIRQTFQAWWVVLLDVCVRLFRGPILMVTVDRLLRAQKEATGVWKQPGRVAEIQHAIGDAARKLDRAVTTIDLIVEQARCRNAA